MHVLVVDDSDDLRELYRDYLTLCGHDVDVAENAERALALVARRMPDLVITDLMMPGMSGLELITRLRSDFRSAPRVLAVSGFPSLKGEALARGAELFLAKPVDPGILAACAHRLCLQRQVDTGAASASSAERRHQITEAAERALEELRRTAGWDERRNFLVCWSAAVMEADSVLVRIDNGQPVIAATSAPERYALDQRASPLLDCALDVLQSDSSLIVASRTVQAAFGLRGVQLIASPVRFNGEPVAVVCLLRDVTQPRFEALDLRILETFLSERSGGFRILDANGLITPRLHEELLGHLAQRVSSRFPLLLAVARTGRPVATSPCEHDAHVGPLTATLSALGSRQLAILLCGRRAATALQAELSETLEGIDRRWGLEAAVAALHCTSLRSFTPASLVRHLLDVLEEEPPRPKGEVRWMTERPKGSAFPAAGTPPAS